MSGCDLDSVCTRFEEGAHLPLMDVVLVAVDDGPESLLCEGPAAGEDPVPFPPIAGLPSGADQKGSDAALDRGNATGGLLVARRDSVPDASSG